MAASCLAPAALARRTIPALDCGALHSCTRLCCPLHCLIAVTAILKAGGGPENMVTIMEGEALLNDASAVTLYTGGWLGGWLRGAVGGWADGRHTHLC